MDLTALELGLRNRQLLQVKCFLKIQVETFRYFLGEDLLRIEYDERINLLDKFFYHDWQNVINKIVSVAVVNMSGDYSSMMLAISLFRSIIQSCNQLLLIVKALNESEFEDLFTRSVLETPTPNSTPILYRSYSVDSQESSSIKNKILNILQKQINSITSHLERIYNVNVGEIGSSLVQSRLSQSYDLIDSPQNFEKKFTFFDGNQIDPVKLNELMVDESITRQEFVEIVHGFFPILHLRNRDLSREELKTLVIDAMIEVIVACDLTPTFTDRLFVIFSQSGTSVHSTLFYILSTTQNCALRQKILLALLLETETVDQLEEFFPKEFLEQQSFEKNVTFKDCIKFISIIDLFVYCFGSEEGEMKTSLDMILTVSRDSCTKCFVIPVLEELSNSSNDLHQDWVNLKQDFFGLKWPHISEQYVQKSDFSTLVTAQVLWEYWIDDNEDEKLLKWIADGFVELSFSDEIRVPQDFDTCRAMLRFLDENGSFHVKNRIYEQIFQCPEFFRGFSLHELLPETFTFQRILGLFGGTQLMQDKLRDGSNILALFEGGTTNRNLSLEKLIVHCLENRFYDHLYLLFEKYSQQTALFQRLLLNDQLSEESINILKLLIEMNQALKQTNSDECVLNQSIIVLGHISRYDRSQSDSLIEILLESCTEPELILLILSLSKSMKFEHLLRFIQDSGDVKHKNLFQKYPLMAKVLCESRRELDEVTDSISVSSSASRQRSRSGTSLQLNTTYRSQSSDIYHLLQQAVPQVDILGFFKMQIRKRKLLSKGALNYKEDRAAFELMNFSQNHLSETYGLRAELTSAYYLKNGRVLESFVQFMKNNKTFLNQEFVSEKLAVKALRKSASVIYSQLRDDKLITSGVLFQNLVRYFAGKRTKSSLRGSSRSSAHSKSSDVEGELEKTRLHLLLGKLIFEHGDLDSTILLEIAGHLKRSHFNNSKSAAVKVLSHAIDAIGRKFSDPRELATLNKHHQLVAENESGDFKQHLEQTDTLLLLEAFEWRALFEFAALFKLKKPMNFMRKCANHDNWFLFSIFAQMNCITKVEIQELLRENVFNNECIGEHLGKAFENSSRLTNADSRFMKMKQSAQTSRHDLYSKIFKEKLSPNISPNANEQHQRQEIDASGSYSSPETFSILSSVSIMSKIVDEKNCDLLVLGEDLLRPESANKDFFQLVLEIYQNCVYFGSRTTFTGYSFETTFRNTLLYASISLSNPTFALLACSLHRSNQTPVIDIVKHPSPQSRSGSMEHSQHSIDLASGNSNFRFNAFMCWLASSANPAVKDQLFEAQEKIKPEEYLRWSQEKSIRLIDLLSQDDARIFSKLLQGLDVFGLEIPILDKLLQFLVLFFVEKEYYQKDDLLIEFKRLLEEYNEDDVLAASSQLEFESMDGEDSFGNESAHPHRIFYTKHWIERCSVLLITNSLLLAKQFELAILLSHYNFVRIQDSFSSQNHSVPDIQNLYFFSQCLVRLPDYNLPIRELLRDVKNVDYYQVFKSLIYELQEESHYDEARNIINLLPKSKCNEFLINEWMLKAKQSNHFSEAAFIDDEEVFLDRIDLTFWENCWLQVANIDPTMHSAFRVMERFAEQLESRKVHIKCFLLIKCLLAIETMLSSGEYDSNFKEPMETSQESTFETSYDLIQEYYQIETQLWQSLVECEFLISRQFTVISQLKLDSDSDFEKSSKTDSLEENIDVVWRTIWTDLTKFLRASKLNSEIIPKLARASIFNNDLTNRRKKVLTLEDSRQDALVAVIQKLLDSFCVDKAFEVGELFSYVDEDFDIIRSCQDIASEKILDIMDLPISVQFLIQKMNKPRREKLFSLAEHLNVNQKKAMALLETVRALITIGQKSCAFIALYYKIACILQMSYAQLLEKNLSHVQLLKMLVSSYGSENPRAFYDKIDLNSSFDSRRNFDREEFDQVSLGGEGGPRISIIDQYNEAIVCARELVKLVGDQNELLGDEFKIAQHLAEYTHSNIVSIVEEQFKEFESFQSQTGTKSEIEIDKSLITFHNARFLILIKILKEPSILGHYLLDICKKHGSSPKMAASLDLGRKRQIVLTELFIRAHDCFTAQCDVQGISVVLRRIRTLIIQELQPAGYYQLILRVLTGIGRYSEMNYCFEIFHDRFEMILSKRVTRTPQLRIALLNYLKTTDRIDELLPLVAVRFFLFRETAEYHRSRAEKMLLDVNNQQETLQTSGPSLGSSLGKFSLSGGYKRFSSSTSLNEVSQSPGTGLTTGAHSTLHSMLSLTDQLRTIMTEFQEGHMNFTKASSHSNADYCARKAQLVALQISYLNHAKTQEMISSNNPSLSITNYSPQYVLNFDGAQVREFITRCSNFHEALILSRGYSEVKIDWSDPFFSNVMINSNLNYAIHYSQTFPISQQLLDNLFKRFTQVVHTLRQSKQLSVGRRSSITNSPSSASLNFFMNQVRTEHELAKMRKNLEQLFERLFLGAHSEGGQGQTLKVRVDDFSLEDKYRLLQKVDSSKLLQKFTELDMENSAYVADLKRLKTL